MRLNIGERCVLIKDWTHERTVVEERYFSSSLPRDADQEDSFSLTQGLAESAPLFDETGC